MPALIKKYPVFVIRVGTGYATISTPDSPEDNPEFGVLVFSEEKIAEDFIAATELENAEVRFLRDERELIRVLEAQRAPTTHMVLDAILEEEGRLTLTCIPIPEMLQKHLPKSVPWNYPVYFLAAGREGDCAAIHYSLPGDAEKNIPPHSLKMIAIFTTFYKAKEYRKRMSNRTGMELYPVSSHDEMRAAVKNMAQLGIHGIALDPMINENGEFDAPHIIRAGVFLEECF